jgi:hypothetical protein
MRHPVTGVTLGEGSPLLTKGGRLRDLGPSEADIQMAAVELLIGPAVQGPRPAFCGLAQKYPALWLLTALNPNKGGRKKAAAGIAKAMGLLADLPDLHLPVTRGPFLTLYIEVKRPGEHPSQAQKEMHALLRNEGHCVVTCVTAQEIVDVCVGYLTLKKQDIGLHPAADDMVARLLDANRQLWHAGLQPKPRAARGEAAPQAGNGPGDPIFPKPLSRYSLKPPKP